MNEDKKHPEAKEVHTAELNAIQLIWMVMVKCDIGEVGSPL